MPLNLISPWPISSPIHFCFKRLYLPCKVNQKGAVMKKEYYENKVCIVTGASTGIGFALSKALLEMGATVYMAARTKAKLAEAQQALSAYGDKIQIHAADVSDNESVRQLIDHVFGREGRIDFLFNNAGIGSGGLTEHASLKAWKRVIDTDLWGVIYAVHAILPIMLAQGSGHIVNTSSIGGLFPLPYQTLYCTAKYGVVGLSETLRHEMVPRGIAVSVVCPGAVASEIFLKGGQKTPARAISPEQAATETLEGVARKEGIIVVGDDARYRYDLLLHDPEGAEQYQKEYSQKRYETFVLGIKHDW